MIGLVQKSLQFGAFPAKYFLRAFEHLPRSGRLIRGVDAMSRR
jgi:hypothetical protein